jgi:tetratricopeptide (TPR) repeat protein
LAHNADVFLVHNANQFESKWRNRTQQTNSNISTSVREQPEDDHLLLGVLRAVEPLLSMTDARRALILVQAATWCIEADRLLLACDQLDLAIGLLPHFAPLYAIRGDLHLRRGQYVPAVRDFDACFTLQNHGAVYDWRLVYRKALAYMGQQSFGRALRFFSRALELATAASATDEQLDELRACSLRCRAHVGQRIAAGDPSNAAFVAAHRTRVDTDLSQYASKYFSTSSSTNRTKRSSAAVAAPSGDDSVKSSADIMRHAMEQSMGTSSSDVNIESSSKTMTATNATPTTTTTTLTTEAIRRPFSIERLQTLPAADLTALHQETQAAYLCIVKGVGLGIGALEQVSSKTLEEARLPNGPFDGGIALLRQTLIAAELQVAHGEARKALTSIELILEALPAQREALLIAIGIYLHAGRFGRAMELARRGTAAFPRDLLFHTYLGDSLVQMRNFVGALKCFREAVKLMTESKKREVTLMQINTSNGKPLVLQMVDLQLRVVSALYEGGERSVVCRTLSDIVQANPNHSQALVSAAKNLFDSGKFADSMRVYMSALIAAPTDLNARQAVAEAIAAPGGVDLVRRELSQGPSLGGAYEFLGGVVLENGGINAAVALLRIAVEVGGRVSAMLPLAHALDVARKPDELVREVATFVTKNGTLALGAVTAHVVSTCLKPLVAGSARAYKWPVAQPEVKSRTLQRAPFDASQIKFFSLVLLLYKVLFLRGHISAVLVLDGPLSDVLKQHSFDDHASMADEIAVFRCIHDLLSVPDHIAVQDFDHDATVLSAMTPLPSSARHTIYVLGESDVLSLAWRTVMFNGVEYRLQPVYVESAALMRVRTGHPLRPVFDVAIQNIPEGAYVITMVGAHDAKAVLKDFVRACRFDSMEAAAVGACNVFVELMSQCVRDRRWRVAVHDVLAPSAPADVVTMLNSTMARKVAELDNPNIKMLNMYDLVMEPTHTVRKMYRLDGEHLHPACVSLLGASLARIW